MRRLLRLILVVVVSSALFAGAVVGISLSVDGVVHHTAQVTDMRLPPLSAPALGGSTIYAADGSVLAVEQASKLRVPVPISKVPKVLINAVLDTEDAGFYVHGGFDVPAIARAALHDTLGGGLQGGSTIAQQLVKQVYLNSQRKLSRKIREAVLAQRVEAQYTRNQVLDAYLNTIYLGSGAYGVQAAAKVFFGKDVSQLTLPEAALLAGNIQNPSGYDPVVNPTAARLRRGQVLTRMVTVGSITRAQANVANRAPLPTTVYRLPTTSGTQSNPYVEEVVKQLLGPKSPLGTTATQRYNALFEGGLKIYTNLDPRMQTAAESTVAQDTPSTPQGFQQALVSIDPANGAVRALVGGSPTSQFDIVTQGGRQAGSGFKIFTLLAALQQGYQINSLVDAQSPCAVAFPPSATGTSSGDYALLKKPIQNDAGPGTGGITTIDSATAQSLNCGFIRLGHEVKLSNVIAMARKLGVTAPLQAVPSMVLGSSSQGVTPLQMAGAYAAVADGGVYHAPSFVNRVVDRSGATIYREPSHGKRIVSRSVAAQATTAFRAVVTGGTGTAASLSGYQVAGKTGTANGPTDAWFNGFTPQLATTVWMGDPKSETAMMVNGSPVYGGTYPAQTFHDFMAQALAPTAAVPLTTVSLNQLGPGKPVNSAALRRDDKTVPRYFTAPSSTNGTTYLPSGGGTGAGTNGGGASSGSGTTYFPSGGGGGGNGGGASSGNGTTPVAPGSGNGGSGAPAGGTPTAPGGGNGG